MGVKMNRLEENILHSFRRAKSDIIQLQEDFLTISQSQTRLIELLSKLDANETRLYNRMKEFDSRVENLKEIKMLDTVRIAKRGKKAFVAAKGGKKFHTSNCPFAKNIKSGNRIKFKSKIKALNQGFRSCTCIN
jgi:predicted nuclease with TOPRIM domain